MPQIKRLPRGVDDDEGDEDRSEDADEKEIALALRSMALELKGIRPG
jgi:hypothetical protein